MLESHIESFQLALRNGVPIATGSDCGNAVTKHGANAIELELMVRYGMSEMDAIVASTSAATNALGCGDSHGTIKVGKAADLIVVEGDSLSDIRILQDKANFHSVVKDGIVVAGSVLTAP